jgi:hypothetical protein
MNPFRLLKEFFSTRHLGPSKRLRLGRGPASITDKPLANTSDTRHVINWTALQKLLNEIRRPNFLENLIIIYLRDSKQCNQYLEQASQTGDYVLWRKTLHELKGMVNNLCLERLSDAIAKAYTLPEENFIAASQVELASIQHVMHQAEAALKECLDKSATSM